MDRGKVLALHRAGWSNKKIADEMACSEASVSMILKEEK
nr:MAG TPA_asm: InsA C-terminal domain [Caudoviricetes sp.]